MCRMSAIMAISATITGAILAMRGHPDEVFSVAGDVMFCEVGLEPDGAGAVAWAEPDSGGDCRVPGTVADLQEPLEPAGAREESESRFRRFRSPRNSAADWYRRSRSFSSDFPIISSSFGGRLGFRVLGATGVR